MSHLYPIVTTPMVRECREFYVSALDARVLFETDWYVQLSMEDFEIGFLQPNPPVRLPMFLHASPSRGLCLVLEIDNVRQLAEQFQAKGITLLAAVEEYPGGEVGFSVIDPAGVVLNIVERRPESGASIEL